MPVTLTLISASVLLTLLTNFGGNKLILYFFMLMPKIQNGEYWRLITPIFVHFSLLHIVFNLLWLYDLGQAIEHRWGSLHFCTLVVMIGVAGNLGEYYWRGPMFGGMSGVVYGLLGYIWVLGLLNPQAGIALRKPVVVMMLIWFVLCWSGLVGNIANMAHTVGLLSGIILGGFFSVYKIRPRLFRR